MTTLLELPDDLITKCYENSLLISNNDKLYNLLISWYSDFYIKSNLSMVYHANLISKLYKYDKIIDIIKSFNNFKTLESNSDFYILLFTFCSKNYEDLTKLIDVNNKTKNDNDINTMIKKLYIIINEENFS